ncbi:hypothetical protein Phou_076670 [Phytohabitans houttuyneae]|uniref:Uncharacterized protein n=1 Tax=Phytohabitans houttuyneae TaxID=1076126 RepID=A0A6V8KNZ1_9ACTN|nr:hypothetical protein Phou_076670 [Phytohabitans houttuyneae]
MSVSGVWFPNLAVSHNSPVATTDGANRNILVIPARYRIGAAFMLGTAAGGMFFNLFSATTGYPGVAVAVIAGLLITLAGLVAGATRSRLAHAAVPSLLLLTPVPVLFAAGSLPADSANLRPGGALAATLVAMLMGLTAAHLCSVGARDTLPRSGWLFACVGAVNVVLVAVNRQTFLAGWVLMSADGAVFLAAAVWLRRRRPGLLTLQLVSITGGMTVYGFVVLGWATPLAYAGAQLERMTHVHVPLLPVLTGVGIALVASATSRSIRRLVVAATAGLMSEPGTVAADTTTNKANPVARLSNTGRTTE